MLPRRIRNNENDERSYRCSAGVWLLRLSPWREPAWRGVFLRGGSFWPSIASNSSLHHSAMPCRLIRTIIVLLNHLSC